MLQSFKQVLVRHRAVIAAVGCLIVGSGLGAAATIELRRPAVMAPVSPVRIASLAGMRDLWFSDEVVSLRGKVTEVYGGNFVLNDGSGSILVQAGPRGGDGLVAVGQNVTVQGRAEPGVMRAGFLVGADGRVTALHPRGGHGGPGRHGPGRHHGRDGERRMPPPSGFQGPGGPGAEVAPGGNVSGEGA